MKEEGHYLVLYSCERCGEFIGVFAQSTLPKWVRCLGEEDTIKVDLQEVRFENLSIYCSRCAFPGAFIVREKCHLEGCDRKLELHASNYATLVLPDKKRIFVRVENSLFGIGLGLQWCSEDHVDQERGSVEIAKLRPQFV